MVKVSKNAFIVVGLGFGDEGKGLMTDFLCLQHSNSIVIRYNGGHQAGHCVTTQAGRKHVFSQFGSGTFRDIPTYWSRFCTFEPYSFINEITELGLSPTIYIDNRCSITTHYDIFFNRAIERSRGKKRYGSCGVGYGATVERQKHPMVRLVFSDIMDQNKLEDKLATIKEYYREKTNLETAFVFDSFQHQELEDLFHSAIAQVKKLISKKNVVPVEEKDIFLSNNWETYIFEGAQGILLDQNFGKTPHVTKSNTTSKNALDMISLYSEISFKKKIFYVTRAYQTRHGAGPFKAKNPNFTLQNNQTETNKTNEFQGVFKSSYLDINQLNYALECDNNFSEFIEKNLLITCLDHFNSDKIIVYKNNKEMVIHYKEIFKELTSNFNGVMYSFSNCAEFLLADKVISPQHSNNH